MNTNSPIKSTISTANHELESSSTNHTTKRSASDIVDTQAKKMMVSRPALEQQAPKFTTASCLMTKITDEKKIAATAHTETIVIPEITDAELLQMALMFENKHKENTC